MKQTKSASATDKSAPTAELLDRLIGVVADLSVEVKRLRSAVDALRLECEFGVRGVIGDESRRPVMHITSLPKDPCAADFAERVNRLKVEDIPANEEESEPPPSCQQELW